MTTAVLQINRFFETACAAQSPMPKRPQRERAVRPPWRSKVYICSPYRSDPERNTINARRYCRFAYKQWFMPVAPHLYFPQFLNDNVPSERADALRLGLELLEDCAEVWVFGQHISEGMRAEINEAHRLRKRIRYFDADTEETR
jgi:hypothetical protein